MHGSATQFKGKKNFALNARVPYKNSHGFNLNPIHIHHDYPATGHFGGPHDNAGKQPRQLMQQVEAFGQERICNYAECYDFCVKDYAEPKGKPKESGGTWSCTGV
jgi:hypothetical protein